MPGHRGKAGHVIRSNLALKASIIFDNYGGLLCCIFSKECCDVQKHINSATVSTQNRFCVLSWLILSIQLPCNRSRICEFIHVGGVSVWTFRW